MNAINDKQLVIEKPIIVNDVSKVEVFDFIDDKYRVLIEDFYGRLRGNVSDDNLLSFYLNIGNLEIIDKYNLFTFLKSFITEGSYDFRNNRISIYSSKYKYSDIINHELLHMSTRKILDNKCHIGFLQVQKDYYVGNALNEGYTEIMCKELFPGYTFSYAYNYEIIISKIIEEIVGKDRMCDLYFSSDLYSLMGILSNYNSVSNVKEFLMLTDYISIPFYKRELVDNLIGVNNFIFETFTNYLVRSDRDIYSMENEYYMFVNTMFRIIDNIPYNRDIVGRNLEYNSEIYKSRIRKLC